MSQEKPYEPNYKEMKKARESMDDEQKRMSESRMEKKSFHNLEDIYNVPANEKIYLVWNGPGEITQGIKHPYYHIQTKFSPIGEFEAGKLVSIIERTKQDLLKDKQGEGVGYIEVDIVAKNFGENTSSDLQLRALANFCLTGKSFDYSYGNIGFTLEPREGYMEETPLGGM